MELDVAELRTRLLPPNGHLASVEVVESTGSTNADLVVAARDGAEHGTLLLAREQAAGRGRRSRSWVSLPGAGLYGSVLLRPTGVPASRIGWTTLLGGLAVAQMAEDVARVPSAALKWPNDVLAGGGKIAGVLAEAVPGADGLGVVLGIGLNVLAQPADVAPGPGDLPATSLVESGAVVTNLTVLAAELYTRVEALYRRWQHAEGEMHSSGLLAEYRARCATLGSAVRVELGDESFTGTACDVDDEGRLVVEQPGGAVRQVSAGDVVHLRAADAR
jgi:BirA family biotin operon repressor/biotin-[acetyl-CoA-carboxylase] ligase